MVGGVELGRGAFPAKLIKLLISAAPMVRLFSFFFSFSFSEAIPLSSSLSMWRECLSSQASRVKPAPSGMIPRQRRPPGHQLQASLPLDSRTLRRLASTINNLLFPPACLSGVCLLSSSGQSV